MDEFNENVLAEHGFSSDDIADMALVHDLAQNVTDNVSACKNAVAISIDTLSDLLSPEDIKEVEDFLNFFRKSFVSGSLSEDHYDKDKISEEKYNEIRKELGMSLKQSLFVSVFTAEYVISTLPDSEEE